MKYRILILPCVLASLLFLFSNKSAEPPITAASLPVPTDIPRYLDSLKVEMNRIIGAKRYDSLYTLEPKFQLHLSDAPDSVKFQFRSLCMLYGFHIARRLGDYRTGLEYYLIANEQVKDPIYLDTLSWFVENEISNIYTRLGDYDKSEYFAQLLESSLKYYRQYEFLSRLYTNKGINQKSRGNQTEAIQYLGQGLHIADSLHYTPGIFSNSLGLAEIHLDMLQDSIAFTYLKKAESTLHSLEFENRYFEKKSGLEAAFGKHFALLNNLPQSIYFYTASIQSLGQYYESQKHREFAKLFVELAKAYLQFDQQDSAQGCIDQGFRSLVPDYPGDIDQLDSPFIYKENSFIDLLKVQYDLFQQEYANTSDSSFLRKAFTCVELGLYANDILRSDLTMDPSKLAAIRNNKRLINSGIETLYLLYSLNPLPSYLEKTRVLFTRSKSILYNEKIKLQAITLLMTKEERATRDSIEEAMLALIDKKYEEHVQFDLINTELFQLQEKLNAITSRHSDIKKPIIRHEDYIEYVQTDTVLYAFSEIRGQRKFLKLGSVDEFKPLLDRLNQYISLKELSPDTLVCRDLYHFLMAPMEIGNPEKLVLIPDGQASLIPFEMLQDEKGELLLKETTISYEYQYEPYLLADNVTEKPDFVFCLAPKYSTPSPVAIQASRGAIFDLPFAKAEVDTIRKIIGRQVYISEDGNKEKCIEGLRKARIFHFSGHAIIKPETAYLALTDGNEMGQQLTDQEIGLLSNPMEMVVLSACETGLGKWEYGEGVRSLGRSFMEAGAAAAIYSLWSVNDRSTAKIMSSFYSFLKKGYPKDEALRKAKLEFLSHSKGSYTHPFHWAAFIATGDMRPLEHKIPFWLLISGVLLVSSLVAWIIKYCKTKHSP